MSRYPLLLCQFLLLAAATGKGDEGQSPDAVECDPNDDSGMCEPVTAQSWLQKKKGIDKVNMNQESGTKPGRPSARPRVGRVHWDGADSLYVEREEVKGFPAEVYYRLSRDQFGAMNSSHVFVPFGGLRTAIFARSLHGVGSFEYGFAKLGWQHNPEAAMWGEGFVVGALEKLHTLAHEGAWSDESLRGVRAIQRDREDTQEMIAAVSRAARSTAMSTWALLHQPREQLVNASMDFGIFHDLGSDAVASSGAFGERMEALGAELTEKHAAYVGGLGGALPGGGHSSIDNLHLTASPGLQVTAEGFWWPLGRKIRSVRGQVAFEPLQHFDMMSGNTVIAFNEVDQAFDIFTAAATHSNIVVPHADSGASEHQAKFFVGPADGAGRAIPPEGRAPSAWMPAKRARVVRELLVAFRDFPADYGFLFEPPEDLCPPETLAQTRSLLGSLDFMTIAAGQAPKAETIRAAAVMALAVDCAADLLRGGADASHSYGPFEAMLLLHALAEFGDAALARGWNEIPADIFCPPSGCVAAPP